MPQWSALAPSQRLVVEDLVLGAGFVAKHYLPGATGRCLTANTGRNLLHFTAAL